MVYLVDPFPALIEGCIVPIRCEQHHVGVLLEIEVAILKCLWKVEIETPGLQHQKCGFCKIKKSSVNRSWKDLKGAWLSMGKDGTYMCEIFKGNIWLWRLGKEHSKKELKRVIGLEFSGGLASQQDENVTGLWLFSGKEKGMEKEWQRERSNWLKQWILIKKQGGIMLSVSDQATL